MERNPALREKIDELLEPKSDLRLPVRHLLDILHRVPADHIRAKKAIDLSGFRFACYYGCLLTRPGEINTLDDAEQPRDMERLLETLGAKTVSWNFATECCGGAHSIPHREIVTELSGAILANASAHGADAVVTLCPMCHSNLDMRQAGIRGENPAQKAMPIFYLTELLGIALGIAPDALGVDLHFVDPSALFARKAGEVAA
jgi:heterodisulfide reductase subunit B